MRPLVALQMLGALALAAGCARVADLDLLARPPAAASGLVAWTGDRDLPHRTQLEVGQLVIHADFPLAGQHRLVRELDALRTEVSQQLGLPVSDEPVHLYLFEDAGRYDAFAARRFPGFPVRRAFFVETDTSLAVFAAWQDRVAEDLRHETTHGYVHAVAPAVPLWLDEGIAEFFEVPRHEAGVHRAHVAHLAGRIIEGTWRPDMERLEALASAGEMSQDHYAEAWSWAHWLLCTTPERRALVQEYLADVRRDGKTAPLSIRLRHAPGTPADLPAALRAHVESLAAATGQQ
ncbi:MAG: DUF1570 domain-containing protein [Planctomycetaceae bacterium]